MSARTAASAEDEVEVMHKRGWPDAATLQPNQGAAEWLPPDDQHEDGNTGSRGGYVWAVLACALTTLLEIPLRSSLAEANLALLYLLPVVIVTFRFGRGPGVAASVLAVLAFDVFLVPPHFSITVADSQYLLTFAIMLFVSLIVSQLTATLRQQAFIARQRERRAQVLFELSRELSAAASEQDIADIGRRRLGATFRSRAVVLFPDGEGNMQQASTEGPTALRIPDPVLTIAKHVFNRKVTVGYDEGALTTAGICYLPLRAPLQTRGVLILIPADPSQHLVAEQEQLLQTCAAQIALAIERVHYARVAQEAVVAIESERLRNSLLSAISHDIRTPLTAIVGLSSALASGYVASGEGNLEMATAIQDEARRMSSLVTNLLDMAKLHAGTVVLKREWQMLEEVVGSAIAQLERPLEGMRIDVSLPPSLPLLQFDAVLVERVFCNLLDNAAKYAGAGRTISISADAIDGYVRVAVEDNGPGIPLGMEEAVFTKFIRGATESTRTGVGLGLAICRTIVEAHGGKIEAKLVPGAGAHIEFLLPVTAVPGDDELACPEKPDHAADET